MKRILQDGSVFKLNIDTATEIKLEGHRGKWTVIAALLYKGVCYGLLEHFSYGDETAYQIVKLNNERGDEYWLVTRNCDNLEDGLFYLPSGRIVGETFDGLIQGLMDYDVLDITEEEAETLCLSDEEMDDNEIEF